MPGPFDALNREIALAPASGYAPRLEISTRDLVAGRPHAGECADCCHWSLPLVPPYLGRDTPHRVPMLFNEWLAWHWHVVTHQRMPEQIAAMGVATEVLVS